MEALAGLSTIVIILLIIAFLCVLPGLITGWMLKASGRSFFWGFVLGIVFGPLGFLVALIFVIVGKPPQAQQITYQVAAPHQPQYSDDEYQYAPVSSGSGTPWAVAGLTFIACICIAGVAAYVIDSQEQRQVNALQPTFTSLVPVAPVPRVAVTPSPLIPQPIVTPTPSPTSEVSAIAAVDMTGGVQPTEDAPSPVSTATPSPKVFDRWRSGEVIQAFAAAGLEVVNPSVVDLAELKDTPMPLTMREGMRFLLPSVCPDCGGRVYSFESARDLEQVKRYYVGLGKMNRELFSWVFVKDNLVIQLNGHLPQDVAMQYDEALAAISH
jgi:hypothetical protein